ncbi:lysosomal Pro-X carboxypeptidase isoform X2 [Eucalyptus grandis]|uniref:lysosomal Pro-X carboxypeptidase isoform X2 n=1 Tax=Eucalyptus grandis TaxID=71139 RepID=UPI00192F02DC|nr:lysosomal Pro-X carboxypeptidase isoform X2 [Eucalyptus grandis]
MAKHAIVVLLLSIVLFILAQQSSSSQPFKPISSHRAPKFLGGFSTSKPYHDHSRNHNHQRLEWLRQYPYETRYFEQRLDHFSFLELPTFNQRYLISLEHWSGPGQLGPIFVYCGNEGDIEWFAANTGFVWEIAPSFGAMVVFPEHRYYGESMPFGSQEEAYKNAATLSYLTADQALADFSVLITNLKRNLSAEACPVVLFGGSYGGMLAAWMRLKYPHIAIGALASSAPILQFEDIVPPESFYDIVSNDFKRESTSCFNTIKASWNALISEGQKENGLSQLTRMFRLCRELKNTEELVNWLDSAYSYLAMVCRKIDGCPDGTSILERVSEGVGVYYNHTGEVNCFELDDDPHGMNGWNWQACTEMVMPLSSSPDTSMFPTYDFNFSAFKEECWTDFKVNPRPRWITTEFGGKDFMTDLKTFGSNIIFSNGFLDPWSGGSVTQNVSDSIVALNMQEGAHHLDLRAATAEDPNWLVEQRATEIRVIKKWLSDYYEAKGASLLSNVETGDRATSM